MNSTYPSESIKSLYKKILVFLFFIFAFLVFLPQKVQAACFSGCRLDHTGSTCAGTWCGCGRCPGFPACRRCTKCVAGEPREIYYCACDADPCDGGSGSHYDCQAGRCVLVAGGGPAQDECWGPNWSKPCRECVSGQCVGRDDTVPAGRRCLADKNCRRCEAGICVGKSNEVTQSRQCKVNKHCRECTNVCTAQGYYQCVGRNYKVSAGNRCVNDQDCGVCATPTPTPTTHKECQNGVCVEVQGAGTDECSADPGCRHRECSPEGICVRVNTPGVNECSPLGSSCATPPPSPSPTPTPTPPSLTCDCGAWQDAGCSGWTCASEEMYQIQYCYWSDGSGLCDTNRQCVADSSCAAAGWFQTQEGDVHSQGDISVSLPSGENFSLNGSGGTPGVVSYSGSASFSPGGVSSTGWLANTSFSGRSYSYFYQLLGSPTETDEDFEGEMEDVTGGGVFYTNEDVTINNNWNFPSNTKSIILIDGKLTIKKKILVPEGSFLAFIVKGNIDIEGTIGEKQGQGGAEDPDIEGVFITDQTIDTNYDGDESGKRLVATGTFVAQSFALNRDLKADSGVAPAELFEYRPDFWLNAPTELLLPSFSWEEVAP